MTPTSEPNGRLVTAEEVARYLHISENSVYDLAVRKVIPSFKVGRSRRFDLDEVRAALREGQRDRARVASVTPIRERRR